MNVTAGLLRVTRGTLSIILLAVTIMTLYKWAIHWLGSQGPRTMSEALAWTTILVVLLIPLAAIDRYTTGDE